MAKDDAPVCDVCLGAGGEWIEMNGTKKKHKTWVACAPCNGTGRK